MVGLIVAGVALVAAGFGAGRVKNASKLAAISAEIKAVDGKVGADFSAVVARIKAKL